MENLAKHYVKDRRKNNLINNSATGIYNIQESNKKGIQLKIKFHDCGTSSLIHFLITTSPIYILFAILSSTTNSS